MAEINQYGQTVGDPLPDWQGAATLPRVTLEGRWCRLEPLDPRRHAGDLFDACAQAADERDWTWLASTRPQSIEATAHWISAKSRDDSLVPFAVVDIRSERAVGLVCFMAIEREHGLSATKHFNAGWLRRILMSRGGR